MIPGKHFYFFTGASGVGKSTLLKYVKEHFLVETKEISARPYLPKGGSYDQTLTDESQAIIVQSRTLAVMEDVFERLYQEMSGIIIKKNHQKNDPFEIKPILYSRGPIDNLAYQRVLKKGLFLDECSKKEIEIIKRFCRFLYIPVEFEMTENDSIRGNNRDIQLRTDKEITNILAEFNIPFNTISGTIEERCNTLSNIFSEYKNL